MTLRAPGDFSGNTTVAGGTPTFDDNAVAKFVVTNPASNRITGTGTVVFNGVFLIDTSAVSVDSGTWSLVEVGGFAMASFGTSFTVQGFTPAGDGVTWIKADSTRLWSFSETSGVLTATFSLRAAFDEWAAVNQLEGPDADPEAVPFQDGVNNLLKYAFNMRGDGADRRTLSPGGTAGLPVLSNIPVIRFEFLRRKNSALLYAPMQSQTLDLDSWVPMTGIVNVVDTTDPDWERVLIEQPHEPVGGNRRFFRVEVSFP